MAEHEWMRGLSSEPFHEWPLPGEFLQFAREEVLPLIRFEGYKVKEKKRVATHCLHHLICATLKGNVVADSRDTSKNALRTGVWDNIIDAGLAAACVGSERSRKRTRYIATRRLLDMHEHWELRMLQKEWPTEGLVVLTSGKVDWRTGMPLPEELQRQPVSIKERIELTAQRDPEDYRKPDPRAVQNGLEFFAGIERLIEKINASNLSHAWRAIVEEQGIDSKPFMKSSPVAVALRQVHSGQLFRCVRLYTWGPMGLQSMSKEVRHSVLIDEQPTVELDFSAYHTRMLYHLNREDPGPGDLYHPERIYPSAYSNGLRKEVRDLIKQATNIVWMCGTKAQAIGAVKKLLNEGTKELQHAVYDTEHSGAKDLLARIEDTHSPLQDDFYTEAGLDLMTADGNIMKHILMRHAETEKPALGVHDSVIVKATDEGFARETMTDVYGLFMGDYQMRPLIHTE